MTVEWIDEWINELMWHWNTNSYIWCTNIYVNIRCIKQCNCEPNTIFCYGYYEKRAAYQCNYHENTNNYHWNWLKRWKIVAVAVLLFFFVRGNYFRCFPTKKKMTGILFLYLFFRYGVRYEYSFVLMGKCSARIETMNHICLKYDNGIPFYHHLP